jgi:hypothetical protein
MRDVDARAATVPHPETPDLHREGADMVEIAAEDRQRPIDEHLMRKYLTRPSVKPVRPGLVGRVVQPLPPWAVAAGRSVVTTSLLSRSRRQITEVSRQSPVRLHLGCGFEHKAGWTNIDLVGSKADIFWDLRRGIPFADNSVDAIFHEHLLEHLPMRTGLSFTDDCYRALRPGGVLRVVVPDAGRLIRDYVEDDPSLLQRCPTGLIAVQSLFYDWGHVAMYDAATLCSLLRVAGFSDVSERAYGESLIDGAPDTAARRSESLYVEGRK